MFLKDSNNFNVATANTLTTARTINGTSFNGSGNITTANWGTARTLTIGNAGKSVNGSGNISWSLSEIGAAAASHTHNYAGSSSAGGSANSAVKLATARTINGVSFDGTANITIPIASHNHDSNYLKTSGTSTLSGNISIDTASERVIKATNNIGLFFNSSRMGIYDWGKQRDVLSFNPANNELILGSSTMTTRVNSTFYGTNNIALARGSLWLSATGSNVTCDYLRFGTNILASDNNKMTYLIDTGGGRATLDAGDVRANHFRLTNTGYPSIKFSDNVRIEYDAAGDTLYAAGTKSSHNGFREFRATQCNSTVNAIIAGKRLFIQSGTPSGVSTGDVWIQV